LEFENSYYQSLVLKNIQSFALSAQMAIIVIQQVFLGEINMEVLAIIPARGGSKRVPRKNIRNLAGKPLVAYSIETALQSKYINRVVVSTEDAEIAKVSQDYGAEVIIRPIELAQDTTKTAPVMMHVVEKLEQQGYKPDVVVLLQPTCPLRKTEMVDNAIHKLISSSNDSVFSAFLVGHTMPLWKRRRKDDKMECLYDYHLRPRSQEPELNDKLYSEDGAFYAIKIDAFKKYQDFIGEDPEIFEVERHIDIDTLEDFERTESCALNNAKP